ncbi:complex I subunit 4 family protein [Azospira restricta]|uniref:NADH-quinone oxidoreductase subunit M n=1 Tax=Azospira restricta TaxID=404405 RepID=A0A974SP54_9RHOO|nr:NADH-quinone oxidoreductase subunit M [Azospira restricta]QRJ63868.1 NADH-quinone oxidoreductase subunit M [Azospira restricta]
MLKTLLLLPLSGALLVALLPARRPALIRGVALAAALFTLACALWVAAGFDSGNAGQQFFETRPWNPRVGSSFALGVDGISLPMLLLATLLCVVAVLASGALRKGARLYFSLLLVLESAMLGVFLARDWSLFYVFWELTLIPLFFLIDRMGGAQRHRAALNFVLYTLGGSVFMLVALLLLYDAAPGHSFAMADMAEGGRSLPPATQLLIFAGLFIGFGVKMPVFPLHGWLPLAHVEAPSPVSILLSGVLLKMGSYGLIRAAGTLPAAVLALQDALAALALVSLIYGSVLAWRQSDLKRLVAYSSVAHMGVVLLGIAALNVTGLAGAVYQMTAHGLAAALLFLLVGILYQRTQTRQLDEIGALPAQAPRLAALLAFAFLAGAGLPAGAGFVAELHVLIGAFGRWQGWVALLSLAVLISAAYALRVVGRLCLGGRPHAATLADLGPGEGLAAGTLAAGILVAGLWPAPLLAVSAASLRELARLFGG